VEDEEVANRWRKTLLEKAPHWLPSEGEVASQFCKLLQSDLPLGALCDILAFALPLDAEFKQSLLAELHVEDRLQALHDFVEKSQQLARKSQRKFPPEFSVN
ncbi:MAG TPA: hypothetical protein VFE62_12885, partial [Gemmataceae bacterium]|nr:hypothetical protein [Gemmataceae bacterium]